MVRLERKIVIVMIGRLVVFEVKNVLVIIWYNRFDSIKSDDIVIFFV